MKFKGIKNIKSELWNSIKLAVNLKLEVESDFKMIQRLKKNFKNIYQR
jgi:hypothetical protein